MDRERFHELLDKEYSGTITANEKYINGKSVLKFYCSGCNTTFFAKPLWLVTRANQKHVCHGRYGTTLEVTDTLGPTPTKKGNRVSDDDKQLIRDLYKQGFSKSKIAIQLNTSRKTVSKYIEEVG
jgi:hypothetical protein